MKHTKTRLRKIQVKDLKSDQGFTIDICDCVWTIDSIEPPPRYFDNTYIASIKSKICDYHFQMRSSPFSGSAWVRSL